ncbi:PTS system fructose subfamily IIA component [Anaeromyxobacter sp. K]|uniref:PTS system fructose subfamily IIA component n=1 Tax=Anaeromyxobacter dehalogenans (strain ATCC BAA-258 / DSM 21875 / 2CP-1) TaxID=455488 RepID=B8J8S7_ANAD2|nr:MULTISPECIES: PTS sugar transporter subunit IIA [Anaeromyxobacter]ACG71398.1 PTS system fructose subfamily IIA component [Anaeromyxobacter sp. K]ACL63525.1 PTS system fructose subfamily IIA component [Anaeromyxobacter dehalogenans 2CP-1]
MVGLVVATHGRLAEELLLTAEGIVGRLERCEAVSIVAGASMDEARQHIAEAVKRVDQGSGVLVLTDMFGGTPANLALTFLGDKLEVVTGVNLPMIMKLATARGEDVSLHSVAELVTAYGQKNITLASELLRTRARSRT